MSPLTKIAVLFGTTSAVIVMAKLFKGKVSKVCQTDQLFIEGITILQNHHGAKHFLGDPIEFHQTEFTSVGIADKHKYQTKTIVKGPKSEGIVFITMVNSEEQKRVESIELQIGKDDSKRLIIKKPEK